MGPLVLVTFIDLFVEVFNLLLITRIVVGYLVRPGNHFYAGLVGITEPLLSPVRKLLPSTPGIDWAPLATFFALQALDYGIHWLLGA